MNQADVYESLAGRTSFPQSKFIREIYKRLVTPEEGEMLLTLPVTVSEFAKKFHMSEFAAKRKLDEFVAKGVAIGREKAGGVSYFNPAHPVQLHDSTSYAILYMRNTSRFREKCWSYGGGSGRQRGLNV